MRLFFNDPIFDGQLIRALNHTYHNGADVGECLMTASRIRPNDIESWYREWTATAQRSATPSDPRLKEAYRKQRDTFRKAMNYSPYAVEEISISYEKTAMNGYFFKVDRSETERPTLIIMGGYDGTAEELYFFSGEAALRRGYNCLLYDGSGQGAMIIEQDILKLP